MSSNLEKYICDIRYTVEHGRNIIQYPTVVISRFMWWIAQVRQNSWYFTWYSSLLLYYKRYCHSYMRYELQYIHLHLSQNHIFKHAINFGYIHRLDFYLYQWLQWLVCYIKPKPRAPMFNIWTFAKIIDFMDPRFLWLLADFTYYLLETLGFFWDGIQPR